MGTVAYPRETWMHGAKYNRTLNSTRFMTIYGYVQSNIQHVSPASPPDPTAVCQQEFKFEALRLTFNSQDGTFIVEEPFT